MEREKLELSSEKQCELWNAVYCMGNSHEIDGEIYTSIDTINTSEYLDGPSWDWIIQRKSDNKYFKFNVWDAGDHNGYLFEDEGLTEVYPTTIITYK